MEEGGRRRSSGSGPAAASRVWPVCTSSPRPQPLVLEDDAPPHLAT
ncbi:hypothetical protein [Akkermansia sp.]